MTLVGNICGNVILLKNINASALGVFNIKSYGSAYQEARARGNYRVAFSSGSGTWLEFLSVSAAFRNGSKRLPRDTASAWG